MTFVARKADAIVLDLVVPCGARKVNVLQLDDDSVLGITAMSDTSANFAYRVSRR
ncbi:hypothetical protein AB6813_02725 [bacterium RCC_150]